MCWDKIIDWIDGRPSDEEHWEASPPCKLFHNLRAAIFSDRKVATASIKTASPMLAALYILHVIHDSYWNV